MKLATWNVNGLRAVQKYGFEEWLRSSSADIVCLQEIKAKPDQLSETILTPKGYHSFWHPAEKAGYSGVAIYSKTKPLHVQLGLGYEDIDREGRVLIAHYPEFVLINAYFPNSQRDHARLPYKLSFCDRILTFCQNLRSQGKHLVLCGDFNIAHKDIDLKNPKSNQNNAGFLPEERAWSSQLEASGYIDTFRHFTKEGGHYTWWSYRPGVREKNIGWRLDYFWVNRELVHHLKQTIHLTNIKGSDHCPVVLELHF